MDWCSIKGVFLSLAQCPGINFWFLIKQLPEMDESICIIEVYSCIIFWQLLFYHWTFHANVYSYNLAFIQHLCICHFLPFWQNSWQLDNSKRPFIKTKLRSCISGVHSYARPKFPVLYIESRLPPLHSALNSSHHAMRGNWTSSVDFNTPECTEISQCVYCSPASVEFSPTQLTGRNGRSFPWHEWQQKRVVSSVTSFTLQI